MLNLRWSWHPETAELFASIDPAAWTAAGGDPVAMLSSLREATRLIQTLLGCEACYDMSLPPRLTIQNVLLIGRLGIVIASGYLEYVEWVRASCASLVEKHESQTLFLIPGLDASSAVGFKVSGSKLYSIITDGIQDDAARLTELGQQFEIRQYSRHLIGHEACVSAEARCWKEQSGVDMDPSDICPRSTAAKALIPCYRIVEEVRARFKQVSDAVTSN